MPNQSAEQAKQRMRELSQSVRNAARGLDRAYPNTMPGDRIVSDFRRHSQQRNLCSFAFTYAQIIEQTIFSRITEHTTPDQLATALQSLDELCQRFERQMDWSHYPASQGLHSCLWDVYTDAEFRLKNLAIMYQQASPFQRVITNQGIIVDVVDMLQTSTEETDVGTDDSPFDNWNGR
jgi:hypothetical protein